ALGGSFWGGLPKPIEQGLRIDAQIVRRREHTGVPAYSPHAARRRVMHGASKKVTKIGILAGIGFALVIDGRWCDARQQTGAPGTGRTGHRLAWSTSPADRGSSERV